MGVADAMHTPVQLDHTECACLPPFSVDAIVQLPEALDTTHHQGRN